MNLSTEKDQKVLQAIFNHFVKEDLIKKNLIYIGESNSIILSLNLAKLLDCEPHSLKIAVQAAVYKINENKLSPQFKDPTERQQVNESMMSAVKYKLKNLDTGLCGLHRELGNLAIQLNEADKELDLMDNQLSEFIYPIYFEAVKETFERLKLTPYFKKDLIRE